MEYKSKTFRYDDLNWSKAEVEKVKQEAEAFRAEHNGTIEVLEGHVTRNSAFGPSLAYYAIPEHWPGLLVLWEEEETEEQFLDCDGQCCGCDHTGTDRLPTDDSEEKVNDEGEEYQLTIEYTYRMAVTFRANSNEEAEKLAEKIATSDEIMERIDMEGEREIDYALCDAGSRTIIDWS